MGPLRPRPRLAGWVGPHLVASDGDQVHGVIHSLEDAQDGAQGLLQVLGSLTALAVFQHLLGGGGAGRVTAVWTLSPAPPRRVAGMPWDTGVAPVQSSLVGQDRMCPGALTPCLGAGWGGWSACHPHGPAPHPAPSCTLHSSHLRQPLLPGLTPERTSTCHSSSRPLSDLGDLLRRTPRSAGHRRPRVCSGGRVCLPVSPPPAPDDGQHTGGPVGSQGLTDMGGRCPETMELRDGVGRLPLCGVQLGGRPGQRQAPGRGHWARQGGPGDAWPLTLSSSWYLVILWTGFSR